MTALEVRIDTFKVTPRASTILTNATVNALKARQHMSIMFRHYNASVLIFGNRADMALFDGL